MFFNTVQYLKNNVLHTSIFYSDVKGELDFNKIMDTLNITNDRLVSTMSSKWVSKQSIFLYFSYMYQKLGDNFSVYHGYDLVEHDTFVATDQSYEDFSSKCKTTIYCNFNLYNPTKFPTLVKLVRSINSDANLVETKITQKAFRDAVLGKVKYTSIYYAHIPTNVIMKNILAISNLIVK
jgi:hypothetical protein